jgi:aryl-alcohol dehydrogenase-like predicted oxidoreductase
MGMSDVYGKADETESIATIHAALERGITLLDTGDFYGTAAIARRSRSSSASCAGPTAASSARTAGRRR